MSGASRPGATPAPLLWADVSPARYESSRTAWLVTFVDLTGLMVIFFVLMFSQRTLEADAWEVLAGSFKSTFARPEAVVLTVAEGFHNAEVVAVMNRSSLGYLDALLRQRLENLPAWREMRGVEQQGAAGQEMVYAIPEELQDAAAAQEAWRELATAMRGWKNPVGVRVRAAEGRWVAEVEQTQRILDVLDRAGVPQVFLEAGMGEPRLELVVGGL